MEAVFVLIGAVLGVFTGLVPGVHINSVSLLLLGFPFASDFNLVLLIGSMSMVHTFVDFIPSVLFGAPDNDSFLSVLPGHRYLMKGLGVKAVKLTVLGGLIGGMIAVAFVPLFLVFLLKNAEAIGLAVPFVLLGVLGLMVAREETAKKKLRAIAVIAMASVLGVLVLKGNFVQQGVFFLVIGFFAIPTILFSLKSRKKIPRQRVKAERYAKKTVLHGSALSFLGGAIVSVFPSIGPSQAAFIVRNFFGKMKTSKYLVLLGGINTVNMAYGFVVLFALGKTRTGSAVAVKELMQLSSQQMVFLMAAVVFSIGFGAIAAKLLAEKIAGFLGRVDYGKINLSVLFLLFALLFWFGGAKGLLVAVTATGIGLASIFWGIKRTNSMAFLMVPTILFYLGF